MTAAQRTLEEVGQEFNVTRERIRQIEAKALRKLRHPEPEQEAEGLSGVNKVSKGARKRSFLIAGHSREIVS